MFDFIRNICLQHWIYTGYEENRLIHEITNKNIFKYEDENVILEKLKKDIKLIALSRVFQREPLLKYTIRRLYQKLLIQSNM